MLKIGRNDPCPCGSGKKFKKCHLGREQELVKQLPHNAAESIASLEEVAYGRSQEILAGINVEALTGMKMGIKCIDLESYLKLGLGVGVREIPQNLNQISAGQVVNPFKTLTADPDHIYIAVSPAVSDSTFIHQLAHVLDYLGGSKMNPGLAKPISMELELPLELLEHPKEFGDFLEFLRNEFAVELDADDTIIGMLNEKGLLVGGEVINSKDYERLEAQVNHAVDFLRENKEEIDQRIKNKTGYIAAIK
ncbi:MAG: SEC-C domain-containing protein [Deltaproteobacteria bacterium]|nr:SEC-C domain-containing protein [Deltaproteobacteria bacterium]MBW2053719.1 SEC-C domain-containing protein [Deltaproteobacteria bacterium]MBW2142295.1 SEC-C domain-containing protein [Deltaproteobacteria bacterium]MBW2324316.1 SEC-C domain-containing protein [Deltaproteobacteria bacterium]